MPQRDALITFTAGRNDDFAILGTYRTVITFDTTRAIATFKLVAPTLDIVALRTRMGLSDSPYLGFQDFIAWLTDRGWITPLVVEEISERVFD